MGYICNAMYAELPTVYNYDNRVEFWRQFSKLRTHVWIFERFTSALVSEGNLEGLVRRAVHGAPRFLQVK